MRTVDFSQVLHEAAQVCGLDRDNLTNADFAMIRDFASQRLSIIWETERWPDLVRTVPVYTNSIVSSATNIGGLNLTVTRYAAPCSAGDTVLVSGITGTGEDPVWNSQHTVDSVSGSAPTWTVTLTTATTVAPYTAAQTTAWFRRDDEPFLLDVENGITSALSSEPVGEVLEVWNKDPKLNYSAERILDHLVHEDDILHAQTTSGGKVWLEYRTQAPRLFGDAYGSGIEYSVGAQIWFDSGSGTAAYSPAAGTKMAGNFYECLIATSAGQSPTSAAASWKKIKIPYIFWKYLTRAIEADYLRSEQQYDQANAVEQDAEAVRIMEVDKLTRQSGQVQRLNMQFTY